MAENFFGQTDTGKVRDNNEDTFIAQLSSNKQYILACVIDGVGGYHGGEVAADLAKEEILKHLGQSKGDLIPDMIDAFKRANARIYAEKQVNRKHEQMACVATLAVADLKNNQFFYAHVGDTRLYLLRDGSLVKITNDHSFVGYLEDSGRLTETAAMKHPKRNEINKALGFSELIETDDTYIETGQSPFLPGDMLLLCSDGLTDMVDKNDITQLVTGNDTLEQKTAALIEAANVNGGNDNITVVLVKNNKAPQTSGTVLQASTAKKSTVSLDEQLPIVEHIPQNEILTPMQPKKSNLLTLLLFIICLALLASSIWLFMQWQKYAPHNDTATKTTNPARNTQEVLLQDAFNNAKGDTLVLSDSIFKSPILITDTIFIKADSLFVKARGNIILQRDTAYHGPAIVISPTAKVTLLDSLQFSGFPTAIYLNNTNLILKHTSFTGSITPVVNRFTFGGKSVVNSKISVMTTNTDSVNKRHANINGSK
ncbi:PP2C family protein-serine/threonine phosphatase [Mucilaginibacter auburnensis]|uniref:Serine/threonine protein phosphatase PrpC n=1 Tax=Mucilaginibacter auburnensis TaxID=1457233 RepID=A0A2H9VL18_9SPHI|nr:protein phosphatase 2C domain-containing protein [Mucilaginibacter auburnensis]PJJ79041.1 serine/threonine protein phosphatase PrpC [Mucilaginibacter auburnensis]